MTSRGDVYEVDFPSAGRHPGVVVTREQALAVLSSVTLVLVTSTIRGHQAEVSLGAEQGLDHECAANCDNLFTISKTRLMRYRGRLSPAKLTELNAALLIALGLD